MNRIIHNPPPSLIREVGRRDRLFNARIGDEPTFGEYRYLVLGAILALAVIVGVAMGWFK